LKDLHASQNWGYLTFHRALYNKGEIKLGITSIDDFHFAVQKQLKTSNECKLHAWTWRMYGGGLYVPRVHHLLLRTLMTCPTGEALKKATPLSCRAESMTCEEGWQCSTNKKPLKNRWFSQAALSRHLSSNPLTRMSTSKFISFLFSYIGSTFASAHCKLIL